MIACFDCRNLSDFVQVSSRTDARSVTWTTRGPVLATWEGHDDRVPGIYCATCAQAVDGDLEALGLIDDRIDFVAPEDLDIEALAAEMQAVRPDAEWQRLDLPGRAARYQELAEPLAPALAEALTSAGRARFYTHQAQAIDAARRGEHVVQATSAGSGKSIGLVVPVLERLLTDPAATALLVFPLRALANDQVNTLASYGLGATWVSDSAFDLQLSAGVDPIRVARLDGSVTPGARADLRRYARLVVTTPDSLHSAILRYAKHDYRDGTSWHRFLRGLQMVVLDELHVYQGVFGSNVALVLRRLRRMADYHATSLQFLAASATIGNPVELSEAVTGVGPFTLIDDDGSARSQRIVLVCNPPERSAPERESKEDPPPGGESLPMQLGRIAPQTVAIDLAAEALASKQHPPVRTIVFSRSRNSVFQTSQRIQRELKRLGRSDLASAVKPYAATFLSDDRQQTEGELRDGTTLAVVSTNALELGIDIPDLSLAILVGYPGQLSSFRQRAGRVGRRGPGLAVLIVGDDPLQQFIARDPAALQRLLDAPPEDVVVNPEAPSLSERFGLAPAHAELEGISPVDAAFFGEIITSSWLARAVPPAAHHHGGNDYFTIDGVDEWPENLRSAAASESYTVFQQDGRDRTPIGVVDASSGPRDAFVPAVWTGPNGELYPGARHRPRRTGGALPGARGARLSDARRLGRPGQPRGDPPQPGATCGWCARLRGARNRAVRRCLQEAALLRVRHQSRTRTRLAARRVHDRRSPAGDLQ